MASSAAHATLVPVRRPSPAVPLTRLEAALERFVVPPTVGPSVDGRSDDFRRVIALVAATAVGFFVPALALAGVPAVHWPLFLVAAATAGVVLAVSFIALPRGSRWALPSAAVNAFIVYGLALLYYPYFNQLTLLYMLVVAAHAVVHGLRPALVGVVLGTVLVPFGTEIGSTINASDPFYAFIYLSGAALVPWTAGRLAAHRSIALRDQLSLTEAAEREAVMILARAAEAKDKVTGDHVVRVGDISALLGERAGLSAADTEDLRFAGMLHDVGKLHVPDQLLLKKGPLTDEEWAIVRRHTIWGERILGSSAAFELARRICRSHHENWDGSGYPDGMRATAIPLEARIVRLADAFDAMRNPRPYKEAWSLERALDQVHSGAGSLFDPELARELVALFGTAEAVAALALLVPARGAPPLREAVPLTKAAGRL